MGLGSFYGIQAQPLLYDTNLSFDIIGPWALAAKKRKKFQSFFLNIDKEDLITWKWYSDDKFTLHSFYYWLEYDRVPTRDFDNI